LKVADENSWVVVSGAGGVLGSALAKHFASKGRRVLGLDTQIDRLGGLSTDYLSARKINLLREDDLEQILSELVGANGTISLLVNAVGRIWNEPVLALRGARFATHSRETWAEVIEANLTAAFVVASRVAARMARAGGGSIVNFSSIAADGIAGQVAYSAAKAGVEGMTRTMANELGPVGVRVNVVALGFIDVETTRNAVSEELRKTYTQRTPLRRLGAVEEVISAIEFFETNAFVNGAILKVDGGLRV
jgi:3-oxoacyl-[acyl-carrier protein] reductase